MESIAEMRRKVRDLDAELVRLLGARLALTDNIGAEKRKQGLPVYAPETEREVVARARELAAELKISPSMVETVIRTAMAEARLRQDAAGDLTAIETESNIEFTRYLPPPTEFRGAIPLSREASSTVAESRDAIRGILEGKDPRTLIIMGPCSIHDPAQAEEYAGRVRSLQKKVEDSFLLVMRAYVEKSRSGTGWTGFLTDPRLDGSGDVQEGISLTRKLLNRLGEMGVPAAVEFINPVSASYIGDMVSWAAIGARSSGSQIHRDMASGLDMPVGFKNGSDGSLETAIGAVESAAMPHDYIGLDGTGAISAFKTKGNPDCHVVLRGGKKPNFGSAAVERAQDLLESADISPIVMIDCSHGNSGKIAANQAGVFRDVIGQISEGNRDIIGIMLESHLKPGRQELRPGKLQYGISITDECLGWEETEKLVLEGYGLL